MQHTLKNFETVQKPKRAVPSPHEDECKEAEAIFRNSETKTDVVDDAFITQCLGWGAVDPNYRPSEDSLSIAEAAAVKSDEACLAMVSRPYGTFFQIPEMTMNQNGDSLLMFALKHDRENCAKFLAGAGCQNIQ